MKRTRIWLVLASLGLSLGGGCGEATSLNELGGETHWLKTCSPNGGAECGPNLECVCGVCTSACEEDASCTGISSQARCAAREITSYASSCAASAPPRLCVRTESMMTGGTPIYGRRYDARGCFGAEEIAGYAPDGEDRACSDVETYAGNGPDGCWLFPNSCLPEDFEPILPFDGVNDCSRGGIICPDSLSCGADEVATQEGCLGCDAARQALSAGLNALAQSYGWCNSDLDCVAYDWQDGCAKLCPVAVNAANAANPDPSVDGAVVTFQEALADLSFGYCADPTDWTSTCGQTVVDCNIVPLCRAGTCVISGDLACADRSLDNCEADGDCVLADAFPYDAQGQCFAAAVTIACVDPDLNCPPLLRSGLDGDGNCYSFGNCLPERFQPAPDDHPCSAADVATCGG